jgi:long-subunit fatty acid transport protein
MKKIKIIAAIVLFATVINAQDFNDALRLSETGILGGARALSMGNAYTALSNDLSAGLFNPAGFGLIRKLQFNGSINYNSLGNNTTFLGNQVNYSSTSTNLDQFGFVFPVPTAQGSLVFSLGYSQLVDFNRSMKFDGYNSGNTSMIQSLTNSSSADDRDFTYLLYLNNKVDDSHNSTAINGKLNQSGKITQEGSINSWFFSGAVEVEKNVFIGATIDIYNGKFKRTSDYYEDDFNGVYASVLLDPTEPKTKGFQTFYRNTILDWDIAGWDAKVGLLAKLNEFINVGATIRFPKTFTIKERFNAYGESNFAGASFSTIDADPPFDYSSEYDITTPYEFTFGGAYSDKDLIISADLKLIDYSQMKFSSGLDNQTRSDINSDIKDLFRTVLNVSAGAEYCLPNTPVSLRAGFMLNPSPYKDDPSEYDKKYITAGVGFKASKSISIDLGYAYGWWKDIGDNYSVKVSRTYQDITYHKLMATLRYNF